MNRQGILKNFFWGLFASAALLGAYFLILTLVSGWDFARSQFYDFWYFIVSLAAGFGVQIGLYLYLKSSLHHRDPSGKILAVSGTTSTVAMISCCAHYLTNILPLIATAGVISFIGQYQVEFFWIGLAFNLAGIAYISSRIMKFKKVHEKI